MTYRILLIAVLIFILPVSHAEWDDPDERQARARAAAESSIADAAAALAKDPPDKAAAIKALKGALVFYSEVARECGSPKADVLKVAEKLKSLNGIQDVGIKRLSKFYDLLGKAKNTKKDTTGAGLEQGMAIRELLLAIIRTGTSGWHDSWHSEKAFLWYLNSLLKSTMNDADRVRLREMIAELMDYMVEHEELTGDDKAELLDKADELARKVKNGQDGMKSLAELRELKENFRTRRRAASEARKARYREEDRKAEEAEREAQASRAEPLIPATLPAPTSTVQFTSLAGKTEVNRKAIGELQAVYFVALDGSNTTSNDEVDLTEHSEAVSIDFPSVPRILSVVIAGTAGIIEIMQDGAPSSRVDGIGPRDGTIDFRNTVVRETLTTVNPEGGGLITGPIENYSITIDGHPADIVAAQPDQVTVVSQGGLPSQTGQSEIVLSDGDDVVASATVDSWGYTVSTSEVTQAGSRTPIYLQLFGVGPTELVAVALTPTEGQVIEPTETIVTGAEAASPTPIAQLRTSTLGPQQFYVIVTREGER